MMSVGLDNTVAALPQQVCNPDTQCGISENLTIPVLDSEWHGMYQNFTIGIGGACSRYDPPHSVRVCTL